MVKIVAQVGEQRVAEKEASTLFGRPETLNDTGCGVPESNAALMLVAAVDPRPTDKSFCPTSEKSKLRREPVVPALAATSVGFEATLEI